MKVVEEEERSLSTKRDSLLRHSARPEIPQHLTLIEKFFFVRPCSLQSIAEPAETLTYLAIVKWEDQLSQVPLK